MKIFQSLKLAALLVLAISLTVGCASTYEEVGQDDAAAAIAAAKQANGKAKAAEYAWRDTGKLIKKAEKAMAEGKFEDAIKLANKAQRQAENAIAQKNSEMARVSGVAAVSDSPAMVTRAGGAQQYEVMRGDNLWDISAKPSVYDNPYQWPLVYKNNSGKIKDADLIYPGQVLDIDATPSGSDVGAAVAHAKSRGSWSLGVVEDSDTAYLAQ